ncbi:MAG TPA: ABC transporter ATP-binding protein [Ilumatobacter sp.]|nr:ABC transporter ATP-binding protein [Ilumatobacter sp.]
MTSHLGSAPEGHAVVRLEGVVKEYPGTPPVRAVDDVSFTIGAGELTAIVGPSGSGKSTLLHLMGTLDRPTTGTVEVAGHAVARLSDRQLSALRARHIGFVFQQFFLLSGYTALDNVADGLLYTGAPLRTRRARAAAALDRVGLAHRRDHVASKLSGGERQRVAIARALVGEPQLVLADEPTGNLDSRASDSIIELLEQLNRDGATIAVITHDREIAERLPRVITVRDGQVAA